MHEQSKAETYDAETRLSGRMLFLARLAAGILTLFALCIFVLSLPVYFTLQLRTCVGVNCASAQLVPQAAHALLNIGVSLTNYAVFSVILVVVTTIVWFGAAILILWRKSDDRVGLLVALMLLFQGVDVLTGNLNVNNGGQVIWLSFFEEAVHGIAFVLLFLVFCLFPSGKFVPAAMKWVALCWIGVSLYDFFPIFSTYSYLLIFSLVYFAFLGTGVTAQVYRYRYVSNARQRQQTKWILFGVTTIFVLEAGLFLFYLVFISFAEQNALYSLFSATVGICIPVLIPLSFGMAILRSHLWEIDVIINRTMVYGLLTAILAVIYASLIIMLQILLRGILGQTNDIVIVGSTLAVATLFQPLRHRIQRVIDRRFYRRKYDSAQTLEAFSGVLRNEVDLMQLTGHLMSVVDETMQPMHISLWLRKSHGEKGEYVE